MAEPSPASASSGPNPASLPPDRQWVQQVVADFEQPLMRYAVSQLGGRVELAREVVQDTFLKLWQADATQVQSHLAPWLYTVCRNRTLDVRRKERRMITLGDGMTTVTDQVTPQSSNNSISPASATAGHRPLQLTGHAEGNEPEQKRDSEQMQRINRVIDTLPERQREALRLKFQADLSYRDIASVLGITVNHVGVILHTALKTLREQLSADGEEWVGSNATTAR